MISMNWTYELIGPEMEQYAVSEERLELRIIRARDYWQQQLERGRISEAEGRNMYYLLNTIAQHMEATQNLLEAIGWMYGALGISPEENRRLKAKIQELEIQLQKYRICHDPALHPYIKLRDFG